MLHMLLIFIGYRKGWWATCSETPLLRCLETPLIVEEVAVGDDEEVDDDADDENKDSTSVFVFVSDDRELQPMSVCVIDYQTSLYLQMIALRLAEIAHESLL